MVCWLYNFYLVYKNIFVNKIVNGDDFIFSENLFVIKCYDYMLIIDFKLYLNSKC